MTKLRPILLPLLTLALAACGPAPSDDASSATASSAPAHADAAVADSAPATVPVEAMPTTKYLHASPARIDTCGKGQSVGITWDLGKDFPGVTGVQIFVGSDDEQKLFSSGGAKGATRTGPWSTPGTTFRLKNKKTGEEIERLTIDGPDC